MMKQDDRSVATRRRLRAVLALVALATVSAVAVAQEAAPKLGVIDVERILQESKAGKAAIDSITALGNEKSAALETKKQAVDELRQRYQESRLTLAEDKLAEMEKQLEDMAIELERARDDAQRELQKVRAERIGAIENSVLPIIDAVGKELGFTLIFNKFQSGLLFADDAVDITDVVIQRYDQGS